MTEYCTLEQFNTWFGLVIRTINYLINLRDLINLSPRVISYSKTVVSNRLVFSSLSKFGVKISYDHCDFFFLYLWYCHYDLHEDTSRNVEFKDFNYNMSIKLHFLNSHFDYKFREQQKRTKESLCIKISWKGNRDFKRDGMNILSVLF